MSLNQNSFCIHYFTIWKNSKENHACNIPDEFRWFLLHPHPPSFHLIIHQWHLCVLRVTHAGCHAGAEQDQENSCHGCHFRKASRGCVFHKPRSEWTVWANLRCDFLNMSSKLTWEDSNKLQYLRDWLKHVKVATSAASFGAFQSHGGTPNRYSSHHLFFHNHGTLW